MESIDIKEVLAYMDSGRPFDLTYVTADAKRGKGGALTSVRKATKTGYIVAEGKKLTTAVINKLKSQPAPSERNPNHFENFTRNIVLSSKEVRTVHVDLITRFNNKKVL